MKVDITHIEHNCANIKLFELRRRHNAPLPPFAAGAHIDVTMSNGLTRQYSLCNSPAENHRYVIGVLNDRQSRGGSRHMHEALSVGTELEISEPRQLFAPHSDPHEAILFAGGIGITPLMAMCEYFLSQNMPFKLYYFAKSPEQLAFQTRLNQADFAGKVTYVHGRPKDEQVFDAYLGLPNPNKHLYICGPEGFMSAIRQHASARGWPETHCHQERFQAASSDSVANTGFEVEIASSGDVIAIPADVSITQVLEAHGYFIPVSCEQGICGTCLTQVMAGTPEHRDHFLTDEERAANTVFTPCCSRARSARLVLDL
ncbi:MAG: oxidoreductase [Neisseriaceae bacterium]|nr:oxidoreductase [Neisseriaceae bacterium]